MKDFPKDIYELYQVIEEFHKRNPTDAILFVSTDKKKVVHLVTEHTKEIYSSISAIKSNLKDLFKEIKNE